MHLIGFGCSWTYGSELFDTNIGEDKHHANTRYRNNNVWLGRLANRLGCQFDNRAEPANSNFAIANQVAQYFLKSYNPNEKVIICIAWTEHSRMSWYDTKWNHLGFVKKENKWFESAKEYISYSTDESYKLYTENAKLFANSICKAKNIPIIQFNAIGMHKSTNYDNYFVDGSSMKEVLDIAMKEDDRKQLFCKGNHPNEQGHEYFTRRLTEFVKSHIIIE